MFFDTLLIKTISIEYERDAIPIEHKTVLKLTACPELVGAVNAVQNLRSGNGLTLALESDRRWTLDLAHIGDLIESKIHWDLDNPCR